jgi:PAS domain S-box-containing protein
VYENEGHYRQLVDLSPDGIFIVRDSRVVFLNSAAMRMFGASTPDQVLGQSPLRFFHPDDHTLIRARLRQLLLGKSIPTVEETIVGLDGTVTDVEVTSTLLEDSQDRAVQVIVRDITERKRTESALRESEERLSLAFAGAQEGVWDWNLETGAVVYSPHWRKMLGYSEEEVEPHVSAWERLLHPEDRAIVRDVVDGVLRGERDYTVEFRLQHKDGHYVHVLSRVFPVRRDAGSISHRRHSFHLTERKKAEEAHARTRS